MPNERQYRYLHNGENEWISEPPVDPSEEDQKAWDLEWENINEEAKGLKVEFTEDMYTNSEHSEIPEWVNVTIHDSGVLPFKMARGIIGSLDGAKGVVFHSHFSVDVSSEWGGWSYCRLEVGDTGGAYLTICAKHSSEELELNITEQFKQAIGETA
jgi:hypothetical protein